MSRCHTRRSCSRSRSRPAGTTAGTAAPVARERQGVLAAARLNGGGFPGDDRGSQRAELFALPATVFVTRPVSPIDFAASSGDTFAVSEAMPSAAIALVTRIVKPIR